MSGRLEGMKIKEGRLALIITLLLLVPISYYYPVGADDPPFVLKWSYPAGISVGGEIGPLAVDINNDGIMEIFVSGDGTPDKIYCFNGNNGSILWSITPYYSIVPHNPMEIYDLDNDGTYELVQPSPSGIMVYNAEDGSLYWRNSSI
jgi:outer membrane protein assembly factor BamB